jgi:hypothetical protein
MNVKEVRNKITVLIGGKPAKELPVGIGQDGAVAIRPAQTELPGDEFRRKLAELNKREAQHRTEKEKATRLKELANKGAARERAELDGQNPAEIQAGFQNEEREADRALQIVKDERFNLFSVERERIRASRHAAWLKVHADMITTLTSQIANAVVSEKTELGFIDAVLSEHSEAHQKMVRIDAEIDSFNELAKDHKMAGNLFIPVADKVLGHFEAEVRKTLTLALRRVEATIKKINSVFDARASEAFARSKKLERQKQGPGWIPDKK